MRIQVLGCHHTETATARLSALLVNEELALDAGAITSTLTSEEQLRIRAVLISHHHFDHVRDLLSLALGGYDSGMTISVFSPEVTLEKLRRHFIDGSLYPDFTRMPTPESPRLRLIPLEEWRRYEICGLNVTPVPMQHTVPSVGYHVTDPSQSGFFYTGDTGGGISDVLMKIDPKLLITEVTFPNSDEPLAQLTGHMTPNLLERELLKLTANGGARPQVLIVHMHTQTETQILSEIAEVADKTGIDITPGYEGMVLEL